MDLQTPTISEVMNKFGFQAGHEIDLRLKNMDATITARIDSEVAVLTGQDANFSSLITNLLRISDADAGTAEWDEGQNLYTLMQSNYLALSDQIQVNTDAVAAVNAWKATFVQNYNTAINNINSRIDTEIAERQAAIQALQAEVGANTLKGNNNEAEITAIKQRLDTNELAITQLQATQTQYGTDIAFLQSRFADLATSDAMPHFMEGLTGADSSAGFAPYAPA